MHGDHFPSHHNRTLSKREDCQEQIEQLAVSVLVNYTPNKIIGTENIEG